MNTTGCARSNATTRGSHTGPALSGGQWQGRTGRVPDLLAADYPRAAGHVAYVCSSPGFVADTMKALMKARLFPRDIYREDFFDSADRDAGTRVARAAEVITGTNLARQETQAKW